MEYGQELVVIINHYFRRFGSKGKEESRKNENMKKEVLVEIGMSNILGQRNKSKEQMIQDSRVI